MSDWTPFDADAWEAGLERHYPRVRKLGAALLTEADGLGRVRASHATVKQLGRSAGLSSLETELALKDLKALHLLERERGGADGEPAFYRLRMSASPVVTTYRPERAQRRGAPHGIR